MNKFWLVPVALAAVFSGGQGMSADCGKSACNKKQEAPCKDCGPEKCYRVITETVEVPETYVVYKDVEIDCIVEEKKPVVKKEAVKTYRVIEEWIDIEVREPYTEEIKVRVKKKVPVVEEYMAYEMVEKEFPSTMPCPQTITSTDCVCETKTSTKKAEWCDSCGKKTTVKFTSEKPTARTVTSSHVETAMCPTTVKKMVEEPVMKKRTVMRDGYATETQTVTKYRVVPGKKLVQRRICETVMVDKTEYVTETRTVKRTVKVPEEKTRMVCKTVERRIEVDCQTGFEVKQASAEEEGKVAAATTGATGGR